MGYVCPRIKRKIMLFTACMDTGHPFPVVAPPPGFSSYAGSESEQISPSVVLIIIILTVIFFVSGCLHILIRYFERVRNGAEEGEGEGEGNGTGVVSSGNGMEGQLQQLFHLHDSGVEQALIDTMPVFLYKAVKGLGDGSDCPVCLCEFQPDDKLRLLPNCSHAFHVECIDGWLLTHSTCPLCRGSLLQYFSNLNLNLNLPPSGPDLGFESGEESRDLTDREEVEDQIQASQLSGTNEPQLLQKSGDPCFAFPNDNNGGSGVMIMPIKLGKFRSVTGSENNDSSSSDIRRSYSMGSYEYVIDPSSLQVVISLTPYSRKMRREKKLSLTPGHKPAFSECIAEHTEISYLPLTPYEDFVSESRKLIKASDSHRWKESDDVSVDIDSQVDNKLVSSSSSSRRAFSFTIGMLDDKNNGQMGGNRRSLSETQVFAANSPPWESKSSEGEVVPQRSCEHSSSSGTSFAMRTINWLVGM